MLCVCGKCDDKDSGGSGVDLMTYFLRRIGIDKDDKSKTKIVTHPDNDRDVLIKRKSSKHEVTGHHCPLGWRVHEIMPNNTIYRLIDESEVESWRELPPVEKKTEEKKPKFISREEAANSVHSTQEELPDWIRDVVAYNKNGQTVYAWYRSINFGDIKAGWYIYSERGNCVHEDELKDEKYKIHKWREIQL